MKNLMLTHLYYNDQKYNIEARFNSMNDPELLEFKKSVRALFRSNGTPIHFWYKDFNKQFKDYNDVCKHESAGLRKRIDKIK